MWVQGYDEARFSADVIARWGDLSEELTDHAELLHPQMAALGRLCVEIPSVCSDVMMFLGEVLAKRDAISEIENAIAISFMQWPELKEICDQYDVPSNVVGGVRTQWERFESGA